MTNRQIASALGIGCAAVADIIHRNGLGRHAASWKEFPWAPEQVELLRATYKQMGDLELARTLGFTGRNAHKRVWKKRSNLGLIRTKEEVKAISRRNTEAGCFGPESGDKHFNWAPIGTMRIWKVGGIGAIVIKVPEGEGDMNKADGGSWDYLSRHVWKKHHGTIPEGMIVRFAGKNRLDPREYTIDNLRMVSMAENAYINKTSHLPDEIRKAQKLLKELNKMIYEYAE